MCELWCCGPLIIMIYESKFHKLQTTFDCTVQLNISCGESFSAHPLSSDFAQTAVAGIGAGKLSLLSLPLMYSWTAQSNSVHELISLNIICKTESQMFWKNWTNVNSAYSVVKIISRISKLIHSIGRFNSSLDPKLLQIKLNQIKNRSVRFG